MSIFHIWRMEGGLGVGAGGEGGKLEVNITLRWIPGNQRVLKAWDALCEQVLNNQFSDKATWSENSKAQVGSCYCWNGSPLNQWPAYIQLLLSPSLFWNKGNVCNGNYDGPTDTEQPINLSLKQPTDQTTDRPTNKPIDRHRGYMSGKKTFSKMLRT